MTIQKSFKAVGEDTTIVGKTQPWSYNDSKFRRSITLEFHPSSKCGFSCQHCQGLPYRKSWGDAPPKMPAALVDRVFSAYDSRPDKTVGMWRVIISGMTGEPTLNPVVTQSLIQKAKERGIAAGLSTNGILLGAQDIDLLTSHNTPDDWLNLSADSPLGTDPRLDDIFCRVHGCKNGTLGRFMENLEGAAETKSIKGSSMQINVDWIISDLSFDAGHIRDDVVTTIEYLNSLRGVSLLRLQFPFYLHPRVPGLSVENSSELANVLKDIIDGNIIFPGLRPDFVVKLRNNWYKRLPKISECSAASDYGVVIGPDSRVYPCPYLAVPAFEDTIAPLACVTPENLWGMLDKLGLIKALSRCNAVCILKDCFVDLGIIR